MKRGMKVLFALGTVLALASSPGWSLCPFSIPMFQGGNSGDLPATFVTGAAGPLGGSFFTQGQGVAGAGGNDSGTAAGFYEGAPGSEFFNFDWGNPGIDGCPNGAAGAADALGSASVVFIDDGAGNFAVMSSQLVVGGLSGVVQADFDRVGTDVVLQAGYVPAINILSVGASTVVADVLPSRAAINCYDDRALADGAAVCDDPATIIGGTALTRDTPTGPVDAQCPDASGGCGGITLDRGTQYCFDTGVTVAGSVGAGFCFGFPTISCSSEPECPPTLGPCVPGAPEVFGQIPPGCVLIADNTAANRPQNIKAGKAKGTTGVRFDVYEFNVNSYRIVSERGPISAPVFAQANDGSLQTIEIEVLPRDARGSRSFKVQATLDDGSVIEEPFTVKKK